MILAIALLFAAFSVGSCLNRQEKEQRKSLEHQIVFTQEPYKRQHKTTSEWAFRWAKPEGSRIVLLSPDDIISVLTPEFVSACDPAVSYDGKRVIFAGKRTPKERWNIWEMDIDGENKRLITKDLGDCTEPEYMARGSITPPEFINKVRWITFVSNAAETYAENGEELATSLYATNLERIEDRGFVRWRTTFDLNSDFSPIMLKDGRLLFSTYRYGSPQYPHGMFALMTMNWSGTGLNLFYGNHQGAAIKTMATEMPDRTIVFVESDGTTPDGSGWLARVSLRRPLRSHEILSKKTSRGRYRTPHPLPNGELLVSYASQKGSFGVYLFDYEKGMPAQRIYDDPKWNDVDATAIAPRSEPRGRIPIVVDSLTTGYLQCLNVYDSDRPEASQIKRGDLKRVRLLEGLPISKSERNPPIKIRGRGISDFGFRRGPKSIGPMQFIRTRIIGEAPVESDGSFYVKVPADTPFLIQTLDDNGMALQTMRSPIWVRGGSRRGCVGCHEDKELSPENAATQALIKSKPQSLTAPPEKRRSVDFLHNVMPIIERRCGRCHSKKPPPKGLELSGKPTQFSNIAYENLLTPKSKKGQRKRYVYPFKARESLLIQLLYGWKEHTNLPAATLAAQAGGRVMPPDKTLSERERRTFAEWIDLGALWDNEIFSERD